MAYKPPPWFTKNVFNPLAMKLGLSGTYKLTVVGRTSGQPREPATWCPRGASPRG